MSYCVICLSRLKRRVRNKMQADTMSMLKRSGDYFDMQFP